VTLERAIRMLAGTFILASFSLGYFVHSAWYFFTIFVGLNLLQSSITNWCPAESILKRFVFNDGSSK
jgi:hypothetical protein